ncbi:MAG TPA: EAL domain-containing protein, partial [Hyphomicrobiaceae bacterium]|nr:EAL domain-containing protein [Hyphomicrobiaceae bacterium]
QAATWPEHLRIAVNLSPVQFRDPLLLEKISNSIESAGLDPDRLELEITESTMMQTGETTIEKLHEIRKLGVRISMDDFGTGYSSLSYLRNFDFNTIKIDRSFVSCLDVDEGSQAIVHAIISLADCLGVSTTAEGVETAEQLAILTKMGCHEVQGYLFSAPRPECDLPAMILRETLFKPDAKPAEVHQIAS